MCEPSVWLDVSGVVVSLRVDVGRLELFGKQLDDLGEVVPAARAYAYRYGDMSWYDQGALQQAFQAHDAVNSAVRDMLTRLETFLDDNAASVRAAARYYATTDSAVAASFDRSLAPAVGSLVPEPHVYTSGFRGDPADALTDPGELPDDMMHGNIDLGVVASYLSITNDVNILVDKLTGVDLLGQFSQLFVGDWQSFGTWSLALEHLADCLDRLTFQLATDLGQVHALWQGTAGDRAAAYFTRADLAIDGQTQTLRQLAASYREISYATNLATQQLNGIVGSLIDRVIVMVIAASFGTALIETGVGAVAGYAVAGWEIIEFLQEWTQAATIIQSAVGIITGAIPEILALTKDLDTAATLLPATAYQHPALAGEPTRR